MGKRTIKMHDPAPGGVGSWPDWLGPIGKAKWLEVCQENPQLEPNDADFLAAYCEAYEEFLIARQELAAMAHDYCTGPNGALYPHPTLGKKNKAIERMKKFGKELGLAKSGRKRTKPLMPQGRVKPA